MRRPRQLRRNLLILITLALASASGITPARDPERWIGTWATSPTGLPTSSKLGSLTVPEPTLVKGTFRYRLRISLGGRQVRLRFSNEYGNEPLTIDGISVGLAAGGLDARPGSLKRVTFGGKTDLRVPEGAPALSDVVDLGVKPLDDLLVSVYVREGTSVLAWPTEGSPIDPGILSEADATRQDRFPSDRRVRMRPIVSGIDVLSHSHSSVVVTLGDSITDGGVDPQTGERGWPGALSRRVREQGVSVVNAGISGNRMLRSTDLFGRSALARLEQDVFSIPGVTHLVLLEGINDIGMSGHGGMLGDAPLVTSEELIAAYSQIIDRGRELGIKVIGCTILPFEGAEYFSEQKEKMRSTVNEWIRTSGVFDGVIDFDRDIRDPDAARKLKAEFDSGDHLHPNSLGYRKMGDVVNLNLFNGEATRDDDLFRSRD